MPTFNSKPLTPSPIAIAIRRHPFLYFGLPFLSIVVISSFGLQTVTQTRYELQARRKSTMSKEEELGMVHGRKKLDLREEYYRLSGLPQDSTSTPAPELSSPAVPPLDLSQTPMSADAPQADTRKKKKFSMVPVSQDDFENVRVTRPAGVPEWGYVVDVSPDVPVKGKRKEDRWV